MKTLLPLRVRQALVLLLAFAIFTIGIVLLLAEDNTHTFDLIKFIIVKLLGIIFIVISIYVFKALKK